jgi:hypothetical protein
MSFEGAASGFAPGVFLGDQDRRRREPSRTGRKGLTVALLLAGAALGVAILAPKDNPSQPEALGPTAFSRIGLVADDHLAPLLAFRQADGDHAKLRYQARIRQADAARWETLTVGDADSDDALFQMTLYLAKAAMAKPGLFVDLARQSAEREAAIVYAANTQFSAASHGPLETAEVRLAGAKGERRCLGFRLAGSPRVDVFGLACGAHGAPLDLPALGRMIDRLAATDAGADAGLAAIFNGDPS